MTALSRVLQLNIKVAYLDGHSAVGNVDWVDFQCAPDPQASPIILLYRYVVTSSVSFTHSPLAAAPVIMIF